MFKIVFTLLSFGLLNLALAEIDDPPWRYTHRQPADDWEQSQFDDRTWEKGHGGFGTRMTPGIRVSTEWTTSKIWLRRTVTMAEVPETPALYVFHDEDTEIFLNGKPVAALKGYVTEYKVIPLEGEAKAAVLSGDNLLAVHCRQTTGGQGIDVHLIDANNVPKLPEPKQAEHPFKSDLITEWGAKVTAANVWQEYPRPQMVRDHWINLNGHWDYAITPQDTSRPEEWEGKILVPFGLESKLSGVQRHLHDDKALWYRRALTISPSTGKRVLLNFEAVDYHTDVWVNDTKVGSHTGGSTPFQMDVTDALKADGNNTLIVRVEDNLDTYQLRGKQHEHPHGIWYTQVSGIWGSVWMEEVASDHIQHLTIQSKRDGTVAIRIEGTDAEASVTASLNGEPVATAAGAGMITLKIAEPKLWSPDTPTLYDLTIETAKDTVKSYVGIREVGRTKDAEGHYRFTLNGETIFHWGTLDQGWWPDGLLTPPSEEAMRWDVDYLKAAGFNMIRKHIKVEPRRYYAYCDRIGMLVWQDQVSGGPGSPWIHLGQNPQDATWPAEPHAQYMLELERMITTLESHPSIVVWVPFNEAWGQHQTVEVGEWTVKRDPSRLVNVASGGNFWPVGHIVDRHAYPEPDFPFHEGPNGRFDPFIKVVGEFGGHGLPVDGHLWDDSPKNWGYGGLPKDADEYQERYQKSIHRLAELKQQGIAGGVYTQTTDVEGEINGLVTYDRKQIKIPAKELKALHQLLY